MAGHFKSPFKDLRVDPSTELVEVQLFGKWLQLINIHGEPIDTYVALAKADDKENWGAALKQKVAIYSQTTDHPFKERIKLQVADPQRGHVIPVVVRCPPLVVEHEAEKLAALQAALAGALQMARLAGLDDDEINVAFSSSISQPEGPNAAEIGDMTSAMHQGCQQQ